MNDFVAYPSRWRIICLILMGLAFVALGLWLAGAFGARPASRRYPDILTPFVAWGGLLLFGTATVRWIRQLFDRRELVRIGPAGVMVRLWSDDTIPWNEITEIAPRKINGVKYIAMKLRDRRRHPPRGLARLLSGGDRLLTGFDLTVSLSATTHRPEDALAAIEKFRPNRSSSPPA
ncbi:STM3941 family protein [Brevundimonas sp.]|uniref:STM3941 family protein n=1 Tax=Brevundimonas sp. TaxID=1871086 RepID=UPI001ACECDC3|nr:STM3941 family protein [Brevundimonas sp.]MBN9466630.1 hypothetical protein [Brevundimonas sp.]